MALSTFCSTKTRAALLGLLAAVASPALAQTIYTPVAITPASFTADVIANGASTALASTTNGFDTGGTDIQYCLVAANFVSPTRGAATRGLPVSGVLTSAQATTPGLRFELQPYTGNNSLRIAGTGTGAMTLVTPRAAQSVWLCAATGNGAPGGSNPVTITVQFADNTTQVFTTSVSDWFGGTNFVANGLGRVGRPTDQFDNSANEPRLYQFELALAAANYSKLITGLTFSKTQPAGVATATVFNGLALTLAAPCQLPAVAAQAAPATICPGQSAQLSVVSTGNGVGFTSQWQSSPDGVTWTTIAGATGPTLTVTPAATTRYRYQVICTAALTNTSNAVTVTVAPNTATLSYPNATYCRSGTSGLPTATPAGGTFSAPGGLAINATTGDINLAASAGGTYAVSYTSGGLCPAVATFSVTVLDPTAVLTYPAATYCRSGTTGAPTATPAGGTFSAPAGLVINATTGDINLAASTAGTYSVSYRSTGQCPAIATFNLTVLDPTVVLVYPVTTYCRVGTSGTPAAAPAGGTFSASPTGLAINTTTGQLDLAASTAGTYTISYRSPGLCPTTATATVVVKSDALPTFPNVLTPNSDGQNDALKLKFSYPLADLSNFRLLVFSRWGRQVYEGSNPAEGWAPGDNSAGTYYYTVDYTDCAGRAQHYKGWVEVVK